MQKIETEITIIGGGPGGYVAAIQAAKMGARVVLIEKEKPGGTCLNRGCIPAKALVRSGNIFTAIKDARKYGCEIDNYRINFEQVMKRKERVVTRLVRGVEFLLKKNNVQLINGTAKINGPGRVEIVENQGENKIIETENIIIATGSRPSWLKIKGSGLEGVISSTEALSLTELPDRMVIIGGGYIGLEFAFIFNNFGVEITVVEYLDKCLINCSSDISKEIQNTARRKGIKINTGCRAEEITTGGNGYNVRYSRGGKENEVCGDLVLMAVGREPDLGGIDAESLGLKLNEDRRGIEVSEKMETNIPSIYAVGDVTDRVQLAHVASHQGIVAVKNIMEKNVSMDYSAVPAAIFTDPEIATVGLNEDLAREKGIKIKTGRFPFSANGKVLTYGRPEGFVKIITEEKTGRVIGGSIIGVHATDLIGELTLAVQQNLTANEIAETIHAHPTTAEVIHEAALAADEGALHYI